MANRKRTPFHPAGPFIARGARTLAGIELETGRAYSAEQLSGLCPRKLEQLYEAHWFDMAPADTPPAAAAAAAPADPLDRDGDGERGGSLTDAETAALNAAGLTVDDWLALPTPERDAALAAAAAAASSAPSGGEGSDDGVGPAETAATADPAASGPDTPETPAEPAAAPETAAVAVKCHMFGRWYLIDAEGKSIGSAMRKETAAGEAAKRGLPLLGSDGEPVK